MDFKPYNLPQSIIEHLEKEKKNIQFDNVNAKGANSYVIFGENKITKKRIALKLYYYVNEIHEEVQLLSSLTHPNILPILDARIIDKNNAYFVTEESTFGDLDDLIKSDNKSYKQAIEITKGILSGLTGMHNSSVNLLHRDIKPQNILLSLNNTPIIADFGSVKKIPENCKNVNASRHTVLYKPPEAKNDYHDFSSDVYQVGIVFYQLLGGFLNYDTFSYLTPSQKKQYDSFNSDYDKSKFIDTAIDNLASKGKLLDLNSLPPYVDDKMKSIIRKATNPDHTKRYQTVSEFSHALHEFNTNEDWKHSIEKGYTLAFEGKDYKFEKQKNSHFSCLKSLDNGITWRRESGIAQNEIDKVIKNLKSKIRKK
jgi:serine/threonine protein kinase